MTNKNIKEKSNEQYNRYFISTGDFLSAEKYLKKIECILDSTIKEALLIVAIISYSRPFTTNDSNFFIIPNITEKFVTALNNKQKELHKKLIDLRNTALAHSEFKHNPLKLNSDGITTMQEFNIFNHQINIKDFLELSEIMARNCASKSMELAEKINNGKVLKKSEIKGSVLIKLKHHLQ